VQIIFSGSTPIESTARIVVVSYALLGKSEQLQTFHGKTYKLVISDECDLSAKKRKETLSLRYLQGFAKSRGLASEEYGIIIIYNIFSFPLPCQCFHYCKVFFLPSCEALPDA